MHAHSLAQTVKPSFMSVSFVKQSYSVALWETAYSLSCREKTKGRQEQCESRMPGQRQTRVHSYWHLPGAASIILIIGCEGGCSKI